MGTQLRSTDGYTMIKVLNEESIYCRFEVDMNDGEIKLTFEDRTLAETLVRTTALDQFLGFDIKPKFVPR